MTKTVRIRNADWVVAWDPSNRRQTYLEHGDVVFAGNTITFVGRGYPGVADEIIDGRGLMVMPGLNSPWMMPARDPLRSLIFHAADRAVRDVYVDGRQVVAGGRVLTLDRAGALARLTEAQQRMEALVPERDERHRPSVEIAPLSLPVMP